MINGDNHLIYFRSINVQKLSKHKMITENVKQLSSLIFSLGKYAFQLSSENYSVKSLLNSLAKYLENKCL